MSEEFPDGDARASALIELAVRGGAATTSDGVVLVVWPRGAPRVHRARELGLPRLLLLEPAAVAPLAADALEDWVRMPADPVEVDVRADLLASRARAVAAADDLAMDELGVVKRGQAWVEGSSSTTKRVALDLRLCLLSLGHPSLGLLTTGLPCRSPSWATRLRFRA
jgi:hypothetical protein